MLKLEGEKTYHTGQDVIVNPKGNPFKPQWEKGTIVNDSPEKTCAQKVANFTLLQKKLVVNIGGQEIEISQTPTSIRPRFDSE